MLSYETDTGNCYKLTNNNSMGRARTRDFIWKKKNNHDVATKLKHACSEQTQTVSVGQTAYILYRISNFDSMINVTILRMQTGHL